MGRRILACLLVVFIISALLPQEAFGATLLRRGSRGQQVKQLQEQLIKLGFLKGSADGIFGPQTEAAVKSFQKTYGLKQDGIAGPITLKKLSEVSSGSSGGSSSAPPTSKPPQGGSSSAPITATLKLGSRGSQVVTLQKRLNELGFNCGSADGVFGAKTQQAVMAFQRAKGLMADGIVGPKTIAKLFPANEPPQNQNPTPEPQPEPEPEPEPEPNPEPEPEPNPDPEPDPGFTRFHGTPGALEGKVIFVDAGHGGTDPGAVRQHEGYGLLKEKDLVLDMALRLKRILEEAGAKVILTRPDDRYYSLFYRSALVNTYVLQTELDALKDERDAAVLAKEDKEAEKDEKEQQKIQNEYAIVDYQNQISIEQNNLVQYNFQKQVLKSQQATAKAIYEQKKAGYLAMYDEHRKKEDELVVEQEVLDKLVSQKKRPGAAI